MSDKKINIALVGLRFGSSFTEIYKSHPNIGELSLFDTNTEVLKKTSEQIGGAKVFSSFDEILADKSVDAVHLVTPIPLHEEQTIAVLQSGKHCACTVPMSTSLDGIRRITEAKRKSGKNFMMMETTLYTYQFLYAKQMKERGEFGKIQFLRGSHYQDMANWPGYWEGLPPMWYGTHAIAPMVALSDSRICRVNCFGSGTMDSSHSSQYGNPFPIESALFEFENGLKGEATRSLFETCRVYQEGMFVYGSNASLEWGFSDIDDPYISRYVSPRESGIIDAKSTPMPNFYEMLPKELWRFTVGTNYDPKNPFESLKRGFGAPHHGSHPYLVHEFISSITENRKPYIDEFLGGNITSAGLCAHISAMNNGDPVIVPTF